MTAGEGFKQLWPTTLVERQLPGHQDANRELGRLIRALEAERPELTTDYLGGNLLTNDNPAVGWLKACINKTVVDYFRHLAMDYPIDWTLQGWANVNRFGDYHDAHNHPRAYLSGTYYVAVPSNVAPRQGRSDVRSGCISFYDPRGAANMTAIKGDPYIEAEHTIQPRAGTILLWPAFLKHFVHPNLSQDLRISISYNVMLTWSDSYLPDQG
jgi:uncharacterized protein (TIGR02466 family)